MSGAWLPLVVLSISLIAAPLIFATAERRVVLRTTINLCAAVMKLGLVGYLAWQVAFEGARYAWRWPMAAGFDLVLQVDPLALLFLSLSAGLWLLTTIYAIGYLEDGPHRSRFFGFFSLCVAATTGIALAGNLFTFLIFYELLTLATYPLVVHRQTPEALRGGRIYLAYTVTGGLLLLVGTVWLGAAAGSLDFVTAGNPALASVDPNTLTAIFALLLAGLGVKAALFPAHGWLPQAMVAPAPVSALLHAVAVVKAGAFGIIRVVDEVFGIALTVKLGLALPLAGLAAFTIIYGSVQALRQDDLKRRLAYSTVSQVSYIVLGAALFSPLALIGALMHLVHQGLMKITLFMCAGNIAEAVHLHKVSELDGIGRRLPWTMAAFTIASLAMIGVPPLAGFVSKWYLAAGGIDDQSAWVVLILLASSGLNALYLLPILHRAWFKVPTAATMVAASGRLEIKWTLLAPPLVTAALVIGVGLFANAPFSPLSWARLIATGEIPRFPEGLIR